MRKSSGRAYRPCVDHAIRSIIRPRPSIARVVAGGSGAASPPRAQTAWGSTGGTSPIRASVGSRPGSADPCAPGTQARSPAAPVSFGRSKPRSRTFCSRRYSGNRRGCRKTDSTRRHGEPKSPMGWMPVSDTMSVGAPRMPASAKSIKPDNFWALYRRDGSIPKKTPTRDITHRRMLWEVNTPTMRRVPACVLTTSIFTSLPS